MVEISSTSSEDNEVKKEETDDSDVKILSGDELVAQEEGDGDDPNDSGLHVDDSLNAPDEYGRVLVNAGHADHEEDIFLAPQLAKAVKPHQVLCVYWVWRQNLKRKNCDISFRNVILRMPSAFHLVNLDRISTACQGQKKGSSTLSLDWRDSLYVRQHRGIVVTLLLGLWRVRLHLGARDGTWQDSASHLILRRLFDTHKR